MRISLVINSTVASDSRFFSFFAMMDTFFTYKIEAEREQKWEKSKD